MKAFLTTAAAALGLILAGCGGSGGSNATGSGGGLPPSAPLKQVAAPNHADWTQMVSATELGYRMGNPNAPVRLVEYASISCPHCGEFAETGAAPLRDQYVRSGQVSWEYRPHMLFATDPALFALLQCQGPTPFFQLVEQLYADQPNWLARAQQLQESVQNLPDHERAVALIRGAGLDEFLRHRGMPQSRIDSCLADQRNLDRVAELTQRARDQGISSTPTFFINDNRVEVGTWPALEPLLRQAMGG